MDYRTARRSLLCLFTSLAAAAAARGEQIVELQSRPGVKQPYLLLDKPGETYKVAVLYFPGYGQELDLASSGLARFKGNFFANNWRKSQLGIVTAIIDPPSDLEGLFTYDFRTSQRHMTDIAAIMRDLRARFPGIRIFLIGISSGTISAAFAGKQLGNQLAGVVLMSTILSLRDFDFSSIKIPVLFVHHVDDECGGTPYDNAKRLAGDLPFVSVHGGDPPASGPCGPESAHTYFGKRRETVSAITNWMFRRPFPREVR